MAKPLEPHTPAGLDQNKAAEKTFLHKFGEYLGAEARRHVNPDGSLGGIVALTAVIADGIFFPATSEVGPRARIGDGDRIGNDAILGYGAYIGDRAIIGNGARIGDDAIIGYDASIGDDARIGDGARIGNDAILGYGSSIGDRARIGDRDWFITYGPIGSRNAMLTAVQTETGLRWWVGCQHGIPTDQLRKRVKETHAGTDHEADYLHCIDSVESNPARLRNAAARNVEADL